MTLQSFTPQITVPESVLNSPLRWVTGKNNFVNWNFVLLPFYHSFFNFTLGSCSWVFGKPANHLWPARGTPQEPFGKCACLIPPEDDDGDSLERWNKENSFLRLARSWARKCYWRRVRDLFLAKITIFIRISVTFVWGTGLFRSCSKFKPCLFS